MTAIIALAAAGMVLVFVEAFLPGGILGLIGVFLLIGSLVITFREYGSGSFYALLAGLAVGAVSLYVFAFWLMRRKRTGGFVLGTTQEGYSVRRDEYEAFVGRHGTARSYLRPTGIVEVEGHRLDAVTDGEFIEAGTRVRVVGLRGNQLVVERGAPAPQ